MGKQKGKETDKEIQIFYKDLDIKQALLDKDWEITNEFYYKGCYPIFRKLWNCFETDCESPIELMDHVYMLMLYRSKKTGKCQLENYKGESTLRSWIKSVALYYCFGVYDEQFITEKDAISIDGDRLEGGETSKKTKRIVSGEDLLMENAGAVEIDTTKMIKDDIMRLISLMPNKRYAEVIRLYKIENYSNEEVANALGINVNNMYNLHHRANTQFNIICRREGLYD